MLYIHRNKFLYYFMAENLAGSTRYHKGEMAKAVISFVI